MLTPKKLAVITLATLCPTITFADSARTLEYSWLTDGRLSGQQSTSYSADGRTVQIHFDYQDRGRGPDFDSLIELNEDGYPLRFSAKGVNNTQATIEEEYESSNGIAHWKSSVEKDSRELSGDAFYIPVNDSPEIFALIARTLLSAKDQRVTLLPDGEATIERVAATTVQLNKESREVVLYRIGGIDIEPAYVWLDEREDLFSLSRSHFTLIPRGWESVLPAIKHHEDQAKTAYYQAIAQAQTQTLDGLTAIVGARIFNSNSGELSPPSTVFVWDGTISAVYEGDADVPGSARVIKAQGRTLLPALWDMHNHVSSAYLLNYLAFGITNVRDMGSNHDEVQTLMRDVRDGRVAGPDIYPMGFIDRQGEFAAPVGRLAEDLEGALDHVDFYARRAYRGIKIYSAIEPDWIAPMAAAAHARGLPVAGHIPAFVSARAAIEAGFNEITHVNQLLLAFLGGGELDTRGPKRFLVPGVQTAELDLNSDEVDSFLDFMRERDVAHDTTLAVIMEMFRNKPGTLSPIFIDVADHVPATVRRRLVMTNGYNQGNEEAFARSSDVVLKLMVRLHEKGIPLLPGTDNYLPGMTLLRELIYYNEAGIPAADVLQLGTIVPARHMGVSHRIGSIDVGKEAQMFLVDGNPLEDIHALYRVAEVFKGRSLYHASELLRAQGIRPFTTQPLTPATPR
jgi:imidazolonepropionase-like amidohydrolase